MAPRGKARSLTADGHFEFRRMKRVAFLNDTSSWYHWGCTGTSEAIKATLATRGYDVAAVPIQALYAARHVPATTQDFDDPAFFNRFFHENLAITAPILQSETVVINGEGSLHGLSHIVIILLYLAYASKRYCNKTVHLINHSCYPYAPGADNNALSAIYRGVYRHLDVVAVRERHSLENVKQLGIDATLAFDCLPLYIREHHGHLQTSRDARSIIIAGSVAWGAAGLTALASYMQIMAQQGYDMKVLTGAKADPAQDDKAFVNALRKEAPDGWTHVDAPTMTSWLECIQSAALLVSGRFHYTIASCMLDTPCIVLDSNTRKNEAICQEAGLPPPLSYTAEDLLRRLQERTDKALARPPLSSDIQREWIERGKLNFSGL